MEYVDTLGLDPKVAYTPQINEVMLDNVMRENIAAGMSDKEAKRVRNEAAANIKKLMAK